MPPTTAANGNTNGSATADSQATNDELLQLNLDLKNPDKPGTYAKFHGDNLIGDKLAPRGFVANLKNSTDDFQKILTAKNMPTIMKLLGKVITFQGVDMTAGASLVASMSNDSNRRRALIESQVKSKYGKMLHPPLTYLGDAFQYRTADGKFNNVMSPHLGQAGAPYAKTVPSKTHQLGALPDPGDLFDRLMLRQEGGRQSQSGLSSMLIYHATIIIHDIFRTNDSDKNISDSSSYLDLSPLYGYTMEMQRKIRDDKYKLGLLKPDTFAEDRLLRQPPGVCIMLVMYNRYHNYAATQLRRINENGRFTLPTKYEGTMLEAVAKYYYRKVDYKLASACKRYNRAWKDYTAWEPVITAEELKDTKSAEMKPGTIEERFKKEMERINKQPNLSEHEKKKQINDAIRLALNASELKEAIKAIKNNELYDDEEKKKKIKGAYLSAYKVACPEQYPELIDSERVLEDEYIAKCPTKDMVTREQFEAGYRAAWDKLDDDLFNTARLITCGMYIQVAVHDYLRALMGFHQWNTNFTLDPRLDIDHHNVSRGIGNQVTVEFNLLYRFHCAISVSDEGYTKKFMKDVLKFTNPDEVTIEDFGVQMKKEAIKQRLNPKQPWEMEFGIWPQDPEALDYDPKLDFSRDPITGLFDDQQMIDALTKAMDDPISNFGPRNIPKCLRPVEILGIIQARKWEVGTLNDFRDFFGMPRHESFESITKNVEIQNALRDLYDHPDKVELYPGIFCESDAKMGLDPGPSDVDSALWSGIFSDAITLVRSDRFYTTDWNTNSLTSWGMKEVTSDNDTCKSSVFHRLLQRAFPEWFPYNSIQFFHPFYTRQTNAKFAAEQGYAPEFRISAKPTSTDLNGTPIYDVSRSVPQKPWKPIYLYDPDKIRVVLNDPSNFQHLAMKDQANFPECFWGMLKLDKCNPDSASLPDVKEDSAAIKKYFTDLTRYILKRESISMNNTTFQIDATRDFAIPVVTKYVADFLGFGHLIRSAEHPKAPHSENEIYQHITNCQVFLSYNADETKLLKRRKAFKKSMETMHGLVLNDGSIGEVSRWRITQHLIGKTKDKNAMTKLGCEVAKRVLKHVPDRQVAASIMVFVGLDAAYNSVLAFTSALNYFLQEMYDVANPHKDPLQQRTGTPMWLTVQELALKDDDESDRKLRGLVEDAERRSVKLPLVRVALATKTYEDDNKNIVLKVEQDHPVILDIFEANAAIRKAKTGKPLGHKSTATDQFADYQPKHIAEMGVTAMIKMFAQMRTARRGHDTQGRLKKIRLDASDEGYANYIAPMRIESIAKRVTLLKSPEVTKHIYTKKVLRPATETYLTADWDEMVPFPNTWKIRFDGFGKSNYAVGQNDRNFSKLLEPKFDNSIPPFYQPRGASHTGGTFADVACVCSASESSAAKKAAGKDEAANVQHKLSAELQHTMSTGCGMGR